MRSRAAALALGLLLGPPPAQAWMFETHRQIAAVAFERLPGDLREPLRTALPRILEGAVAPDLFPADGTHHLYCLETLCGDAPATIRTEFAAALRDFRPQPWPQRLAAALSALVPVGCARRRQPLAPEGSEGLGFRLGVLSHYLADVSVPYHTLPYEGEARVRHLDFEHEVEARRSGLAFTYDGRLEDVATDPEGFAIALARGAREDLRTVDDPALDHGSERYRAAVDRSYARAVNAVLDAWNSLLTRTSEGE